MACVRSSGQPGHCRNRPIPTGLHRPKSPRIPDIPSHEDPDVPASPCRIGGRTPDLARFQFLDPASRDFYPDWELFSQMCVGIMRTEAGRDPHDRTMQVLAGELSTRSETFRALWGAHDVRTHGSGTKRFHHPVAGELTLAHEELAITAEPRLVLMVYTAEPGSPSAERIRLLASWGPSEDTAIERHRTTS
jgi:hypothetical protein